MSFLKIKIEVGIVTGHFLNGITKPNAYLLCTCELSSKYYLIINDS